MRILVLNCGSSSAKFAVIDPGSGAELVSGLAERLGQDGARLVWKRDGVKQERTIPGADHDRALRAIVQVLDDEGLRAGLAGIGHRVVHGGPRFTASCLVDAEVEAGIEACFPLGPLHNPPNLLGIRIAKELFAGLPNVAVFDTAFHSTMPERAFLYPVPWAWYEQHQVRRYGFHGTSHRFVAEEAIARLGLQGRADSALVTAHLGNGCSAAAILGGRCIDTTMGLTPLEGLVMGTRSGDVDPALIGYVAGRLGIPATQVIDALNKQSGLLGLSGSSNDMRTLIEKADGGDRRAALAIEVFCYRLAKTIGGLATALGRLDAVVFTGGIGENSVAVRARVCALLGILGIQLDPARNAEHGRSAGGVISSGAVRALVVPTNEELMIARDTAALVGGTAGHRTACACGGTCTP
jgi:acetate kinase